MVRIIPDIPNIKARWCHRCSEVPDWLEVPMSDGRLCSTIPGLSSRRSGRRWTTSGTWRSDMKEKSRQLLQQLTGRDVKNEIRG